MTTTANNLLKSQANSCVLNEDSQLNAEPRTSMEPYKFYIDCRTVRKLWVYLWMKLSYFEEGEHDTGKTKIRFGKDTITIWVDRYYCAIINALDDIRCTYPEACKADKRSREWLDKCLKW